MFILDNTYLQPYFVLKSTYFRITRGISSKPEKLIFFVDWPFPMSLCKLTVNVI